VRAVVPVHLYGRVADVAIEKLAREVGLAVVQDAAHGARWLGGTACMSFFPAKSLGAWGDGGAVITDDPSVADAVRRLREHGRSARQHYEAIGLNSRLDALQAAVLGAKLPHLEAHEARRRDHAARYSKRLAGISSDLIPAPPLDDGEVCQLYTVRVLGGRREALREHLAMQGIETAVHYATVLCDQPAIAPYLDGETPAVPNARRATGEVLSLPCHPFLASDAVDRVVDAIDAFFARAHWDGSDPSGVSSTG
jgi:dTDP-3-amino-3,4,6-trideoxy-alpha-D-glucose transaminase